MDGWSSLRLWWFISSWMGKSSSIFIGEKLNFIRNNRITYSMGEVFLQPMMDRLNSERGPVSTIFGILPAITLATGPIATIFTNTYGCRKVTIVGACLAALGFLASCFWANIWFYYLTIGVIGGRYSKGILPWSSIPLLSLLGLGFGLIYLPAIVSVGFYFEKKRSSAMGIAVCGSGLGTLVFPAIMPYILNHPSWLDYDGALLVEAAIIFICVIFGVLMVRVPFSRNSIDFSRVDPIATRTKWNPAYWTKIACCGEIARSENGKSSPSDCWTTRSTSPQNSRKVCHRDVLL